MKRSLPCAAGEGWGGVALDLAVLVRVTQHPPKAPLPISPTRCAGKARGGKVNHPGPTSVTGNEMLAMYTPSKIEVSTRPRPCVSASTRTRTELRPT